MADAFSREQRAKYWGEFMGTLFLTLTVKLSVAFYSNTYVNPALIIGLTLCVLVYSYGYITGAHYNPSVTMAVLCRNTPAFPYNNYLQIIMYFLSQYLGAICGGLLAWGIGGKDGAAPYPTIYPAANSDDALMGRAFLGEFVFTYFLCTTILHVATDARQGGNQFYGLAIGLTLMSGVACIGAVSGCCLNSAVWVGTIVAAAGSDQLQDDVDDAWIYWLATLGGGATAGFIFQLFNGPESAEAEKDKMDAEIAAGGGNEEQTEMTSN